MKRSAISVGAGIITGLFLLPFSGVLLLNFAMVVVGACLVSVSISICVPVRPVIYGASLMVTVIVVSLVVIDRMGGNLSGLIVILVSSLGAIAGGAAAILGSLLRNLNLPSRTGLIAAPASLMFLVGGLALSHHWQSQRSNAHATGILTAIEIPQ